MSFITRLTTNGRNDAGDNHDARTYAAAMERGEPFIRLELEVDQPIELGDFVGAFTALASEYDRFIRSEHPGMNPEATLFVKEVRAASVHADLIPWIVGGGLVATGVAAATAYNAVDEFVERLGNRIRTYTKPGGRLIDATKAELKDFLDQTAAIANNPGSRLRVAAMEVESGKQRVRVAFELDTTETREVQQRIEEHKREIDHTSRADHERVLMVFVRSDIRGAAVGKRSGELVKIEALSDKPRPLIYASALAEQEIKTEIADDDSVYKKGFVVDVNMQTRGGQPVAYAVTNLHQVVDLPDDED